MPTYRDKNRGRIVFDFDRIINGQRIRARKLLPKTWTQAQADAYDRQESARLYAVASGIEKPDGLIEDAIGLYLKHRAKELKSAANIEAELALMFWAYKGRQMGELADVCREYAGRAIKDNGEPLSMATIRNRIRYLTSACRYAWKHHGMGLHDPGEKVHLPAVSNERQHYITRKQMLQIARKCRCRSSRAAIRIAFYSGMRMSEIIQADAVGENFVLADSKNGRPRIVPIHPKIKACLSTPLKDRFWTSKRFKEAAVCLGLGHLRFHDLRHAAASAMINAQVDLYTVGAVLGHKSAASTRRYAHLATDTLRAAVGKIAGKHAKKSPNTKKKEAA